MKRSILLLNVVLVISLLVGGCTTPTPTPTPVPPTPTPMPPTPTPTPVPPLTDRQRIAEGIEVIYVLDDSGSMGDSMGDTTKLHVAKRILADHLQRDLPRGARYGMVVFSHRTGECDDVEVVFGIDVHDVQQIAGWVDNLEPGGWTPLAESLRQAAECFSEGRTPTVIFLSDGHETCEKPDAPCKAMKRLRRDFGIKVIPYIIGFKVPEEERGNLECIAREGGGWFVSADNEMELREALATVSDQAWPEDCVPYISKVRDIDFTVCYPLDWTVREEPDAIVFVAPDDSEVGITSQALSEVPTAMSLLDDAADQKRQEYPDLRWEYLNLSMLLGTPFEGMGKNIDWVLGDLYFTHNGQARRNIFIFVVVKEKLLVYEIFIRGTEPGVTQLLSSPDLRRMIETMRFPW